jgi:hypothetical protein
MRTLLFAASFVVAGIIAPAEACQFPQVLIRHLGECVSPRSKLAMAFVPVTHFHFARPRPRPAPAPPRRVYEGPPLLPAEYPARPVSYTPRRETPLPDLEAGVPPSWRICIEHPDWCHNEGQKP